MEAHQTPDNLHLRHDKLTASYRARRISDETWDRWRETIVHLYIQENMARKELVDAMAKEHGFNITEKQLKHRLQKWNIKKYLGTEDRKTLVSLKRKWHDKNKEPVLEYRGHILESARLERLYKRSKGDMLSPRMPSSHIKAVGILSPSTPLLEAGIFAHMDDTVASLPPVSETELLHPKELGIRNAMNTTPEWPLGIFRDDTANCNHFDASPALWDNTDAGMIDFFDIPNLEPNQLQSWDISPLDIEKELHHIPENDYRSMIACTTNVNKSSSSRSDINSSCSLKFSAFEGCEFSATDLEVVSQINSPRLPELNTYFSTMLRSRTNTPINALRSGETHSKMFPEPSACEPGLDTIGFCGTDPNMVTVSLVLMQKAFLTLLATGTENATLWEAPARGTLARLTLADMVNSDWLQFEIENLVCLGHETASRFIRERQASRSCQLTDGNAERSVENHSNKVPRSSSRAQRSKRIGYCVNDLSTGKLRVDLNVVSNKTSNIPNQELSYRTQVCFVPKPHICTTVVSALFSRFNMTQGSVPAQITTFNIVPYDAEVICRVIQGDVQGVRRLFEKKQASPRDVDPDGSSLLSYAIDPKCLDVFRLLIESGAATENCKLSWSVQTAIWYYCIYALYYPSLRNFLTLDDIKSLSNIASKHGCEFEDIEAHDGQTPNFLFLTLSESFGCVGGAYGARTNDIINALVDYGCCIEEKNNEGRTVFLFAVSLFYKPNIVSTIKALLQRGVNRNETDNEGGGVFHVVFWGIRSDPYLEGIRNIHNCPSDSLMYWKYLSGYEHPENLHDDVPTTFFKDSDTVQLRSERADRSRGHIRVGDEQHDEQHDERGDDDRRDNDREDADDRGDDNDRGDNDWDDDNCGDDDWDDDNRGDDDKCGDDDNRGDDDWNDDWNVDWDNDYSNESREIVYRKFQFHLRTVLFQLLQAGCNPNLLDLKGYSPSHYAREDDMLWPHWIWALRHTGYVYEESSDTWVRPSEFDEMLEVMVPAPSTTADERPGLDACG
ncbi:hypothetical protein MMC26_004047 [Xylographa opegraphella]|nr:hypothetical protein [Xylographa opegraphella]